MQHWQLCGLRGVADGRATLAAPRMSNAERLARWADALELQGLRCLRTIDDSGLWVRARTRRADDSPLSAAAEDWALRAEGLDGDSMADALEFFGLSPGQIRRLVGASRHGRSVPAAAVAAAIRTLMQHQDAPARPRPAWLATGASAFAVLALILAVPLLLASL